MEIEAANEHRSNRRSGLIKRALVILALVLFVLSVTSPGVVPRLAIFPKPADVRTNPNCLNITERYERVTIFWLQRDILGSMECKISAAPVPVGTKVGEP